jgi:4-amino-4-deoxychorismate lyase
MLDALIDGQRVDAISVAERGLHYADGIFESIRREQGEMPLWPWHQARLAFAARASGLILPDADIIRAQLKALAPGQPSCAIKLMLWATEAERGYGRRWPERSLLALLAYPLPTAQAGIKAVSATVPLAAGGSPRGLKSLARFEQVRAHSQALAAGADAALLRDDKARPLCFSHGNLYARLGSRLLTPPVAHGALAGVTRAWLLGQTDLHVQVAPLSASLLAQSDEVLFSNALRGVLPVSVIDGRKLVAGEWAARLARRWQNLMAGRSGADKGTGD